MKIAVVLLKSRIGMHSQIKNKLDCLKLKYRHQCVLVDPKLENVVKKLGNYVIWGFLTENLDKDYKLQSPRGGYNKISKKINGVRTFGFREDIDNILKLMQHEC